MNDNGQMKSTGGNIGEVPAKPTGEFQEKM